MRLTPFDQALEDEREAERQLDKALGEYHLYRAEIGGTNNTDPKYTKLKNAVVEAQEEVHKFNKLIAQLWED